MLEIRNLTKRFNGIPAVDSVSFSIRAGEILGYVGSNGAGKSTTVKMIIGLLEPSEGRILFQGRSVIEDLVGFQSRLGYVPEAPNLYPYLSGWEYLQLVGRLRGLRRNVLEPSWTNSSICFRSGKIGIVRCRPTPKACGRRSCSRPRCCTTRTC